MNYWKIFAHVVQLRKIMRQDSEEQTFLSLPQRLPRGKCPFEDYALLNGRLVGSTSVPTINTTQ